MTTAIIWNCLHLTGINTRDISYITLCASLFITMASWKWKQDLSSQFRDLTCHAHSYWEHCRADVSSEPHSEGLGFKPFGLLGTLSLESFCPPCGISSASYTKSWGNLFVKTVIAVLPAASGKAGLSAAHCKKDECPFKDECVRQPENEWMVNT